MPDTSDATSFWNPGTKRGLLVYVGLMIGLKIVDTLVQDGGVLAPSWRWPLIAGLCGGVYASIVNAYRLGMNSERTGMTDG